MTFTPSDVDMFKAIGVSLATMELAQVRRVTHHEAQEVCGIRYKSAHLEGIAFPYLNPGDDSIVGWRVRRDNPEIENGEPIAKYLSSPDRKHLYFAPSCHPQLSDTSASVIIVEAEKSALALLDAENRAQRPRGLYIATGGCWGWRGTIGKTTSPGGARVDEKGPLSDLDRVTWQDRDTIIVFDANVATNTSVQAARRALATELTKRGARVRLADLPVGAGVNGPDDYIGKHGDAAFWELIDAARPAEDEDGRNESGGRGRGPSQATKLIDLAIASGMQLWHTPSGDAFGTIDVDGHHEHHPLRRVIRDDLARRFYRAEHASPSSAALTDALATLGGMARFDGPEHTTAVRLGSHDGRLYLDLGDPSWRAVEIDAAGWRVVSTAPVRHWRPASLRALPEPVTGGTLDGLRAVFPLDDDTWTTVASWLVATLAPTGPYPMLVETGEQGSGKSTLARMLRGIVDPASPVLRGVPRDERDVMIGALTSHVLTLDNLSGLPVWLSDALCRISTGGGLATRTLYTDLDETTIDVMRPILLTGIDNPAGRGDLLDRALVVTLPAMSDEARGDEVDLWRRYDSIRPALVGALCSAASTALRLRPYVTLDKRPRMADACTWVTAAEPALGWENGRTAVAWLGARKQASADLIAGNPVANTVMQMAMPWSGTAAELLAKLNMIATDTVRNQKSWPTTARGLSGALRHLAPDLRRVDLEVKLPIGAKTGRERVIEIRQGLKRQDKQVTQDAEGESPNDSADPACPVACPVDSTGQATGHQQDSRFTNESGGLSGVSYLSCPTHPDHVVDRDGEPRMTKVEVL